MAYPLLLLFIVCGSVVLRDRYSPKAELFWICFVLFIFFAFRSPSVGTDTYGYCKGFVSFGSNTSSIKEILNSDAFEKGFRIYQWLLYRIAPFQQALLIAHASIFVFSYKKYLERFSSNYLLSTIFFLVTGLGFNITGMRQSIAMSICMIAYIFIYDKKYIKALFLILIAITFHNSAFIFLLVYLFGAIWKKRNNLITTGILGAVVVGSMNWVLPTIIQYNEKWIGYLDIETTDNGIVFFAVLIVIEILFYVVRNRIQEQEKFHVRVSYLSLILWVGRLLNRTYERAAMYFFPSFEAEIPNALYAVDERYREIVKWSFVILMSALYIYRTYGRYYNFFFFE